MKKKDKINWENKVENILKSIEITEEDFKRSRATSLIHKKVLDAVGNEWNISREPVMEEIGFQMDFVGRVFPRHGKIELAMEVDIWNKPLRNWVKLLDINATTKIWIYLCREKNRAIDRIQEARKEFRKLALLRREDKTNEVVIFMKVSGERDVKKYYLSQQNTE